jgi:predicted transposase YbfD/YdcC
LSDPVQGHAPQRQDEDPPPFRRQAIPENRAQLTELVHRETQANVPTRAVLGIQSSAISRVLSNYQRCFVWGIENRSHYVRDVTMNEDQARNHKDNGPENLAVFRHLALNLVSKDTSKGSLRVKLLRAAWNTAFLRKLLAQI